MTVAVVGLGLIGGSFARAFTKAGHTVYADEKDEKILGIAALGGVVAGALTDEMLSKCELVILALYPAAVIDWLTEHAGQISPDALVLDTCGTKEKVCRACFPLAEQYGFTFIGGHPMAGTEQSGFKHSRDTMFKGASMVLVPPRFDDPTLTDRACLALEPCRFGRFTVTTAQEHDRMIAFTSQLPHLASSAFIKSPTAGSHRGFSAGSYKDLTRVAWLNETMWTELFLDNRDNLLAELDTLLENLSVYRGALEKRDAQTLCALLREGREKKEAVDR